MDWLFVGAQGASSAGADARRDPRLARDDDRTGPAIVTGTRPKSTADAPASPKMPVGVPGRMAGTAGQAVAEFGTALRDELSDPLTPVLATGSAASAVLGSPVDAVLVGSVLAFNSALAATQQVRAQRLLRRMLAVQVPPARTVQVDAAGLRGYADVDAAQLRPGDLIEVRSGEVIPADARLSEVTDLEVDESTLTGESLPVTKQLDATPGAALAERSCMLFAATTVVAGTGLAVVTAVGRQTQVRRAAEVPRAERGPVGLQTRLRELTDRAWPISLAGEGLVSALALCASAACGRPPAVRRWRSLRCPKACAGGKLDRRLGAAADPAGLAMATSVAWAWRPSTWAASTRRHTREPVSRGVSPRASDGDVLPCAAQATPSPVTGHHPHATDAAVIDGAASTSPPGKPPRGACWAGQGATFSATVVGQHLTVKGAPEVVLDACDRCRSGGGPRHGRRRPAGDRRGAHGRDPEGESSGTR